ncbi:selenide, water dikinase SelD [Alphaproteobacteria bacterium]|nr:selenide, water dikinase SelD [Alphaproteobacteria bacterium]
MKKIKAPKFKVLVLVGAGHANIQVLKKLTMKNYEGLQIITINNGYTSLYSGMTPGLIENYYVLDDASIDLVKLCKNAGSVFINDEVIKLDEKKNIIYLKNHPPIKYNLLSLNIGCQSKINNLEISKEAEIIKVKPISNLVNKINSIEKLILKEKVISCSIIGGGIGGIEIAFALQSRYQNSIKLNLFVDQNNIEKNINSRTYKKLITLLSNKNINFVNTRIKHIKENHVEDEEGRKYPTRISIISTGAMSLPWIVDSGLSLDESGFINVNSFLQSENHKNIFATGDIASLNYQIRAKSGVMAVRQGEKLKENLFRFLLNKDLIHFKPQSSWLCLIGTGGGNALLNWGQFTIHGKQIWQLKEFIDRKFMKKFSFENPMNNLKDIIKLPLSDKIINQINLKMRCEGCGSKLSKDDLSDYLHNSNSLNAEVLSDAATIHIPSNEFTQSIDHIKYFAEMNPYNFGRIAYLHSQNDILSAGSEVNSFSVSLGLPYNESEAQKYFLEYFMQGINSESEIDKSIFASGHTYTSEEPGITINMNGIKILDTFKNQAFEGDLIYLTKPLGIGFLMAAFNHNSINLTARVYEKIINNMLISNKSAFEIAKKYNAKPLTDISGFGLGSHLIDICKSSNLSASLTLNRDIVIDGCLDDLKLYKSSAYEDNRNNAISEIEILDDNNKEIHNISKILFDPQTSGPLLISLNQDLKQKFEIEFEKIYDFKPILIGYFQKKKKFSISVR